MKIQIIENSLGEDIREVSTPEGLTVILNPRSGFARTFAIIGTHFGSIDVSFADPRDGRPAEVPDGVAHFLEHKLFEDAEGDVSDRFARNGASSNARTGFTSTAYLFACTDKVAANLQLLLDFVFEPYFTDAGVAKEQGIIEQEIQMYRDDPDWRLFFNLLEALYHVHPVRIDIAGSPESIHRITPGILQSCYQAFYHPANMTLAVAGAFDADEILELVTTKLSRRRFDRFRGLMRPDPGEPPTVRRNEVIERMVVARPKLALGFKESRTDLRGRALERFELITQLGLDLILGRSSTHREKLVNEGLIDDAFSAGFTLEPGFGFTMISADTDQPQRLRDRLLEIIRICARDGFPPEEFERLRRRYLGRLIRLFNSVDATAAALLEGTFRGVSPFESFALLSEISLSEVEERLREHARPEASAVSLVLPLETPKTNLMADGGER